MPSSLRPTGGPGCLAPVWKNGRACGRKPAPGSQYCSTHQFILEPAGAPSLYASALDPEQRQSLQAAAHLSLADEVALARLQVRKLVDADAPATQILNALRTLSLLARLQDRFDRSRPRPTS